MQRAAGGAAPVVRIGLRRHSQLEVLERIVGVGHVPTLAAPDVEALGAVEERGEQLGLRGAPKLPLDAVSQHQPELVHVLLPAGRTAHQGRRQRPGERLGRDGRRGGGEGREERRQRAADAGGRPLRPNRLQPTPELGSHVQALHQGVQVARGTLIAQSHEARRPRGAGFGRGTGVGGTGAARRAGWDDHLCGDDGAWPQSARLHRQRQSVDKLTPAEEEP
mmetsp:Transcript_6341/g.20841  ORF Transcript_6341/g.20841 Transcript_6341/m.20841 type:complete len:221 (+) Transcript_6341:1405-2067(+)|eukprot:scaffold9676_cov113-Isochrysis_galbana.AAC.8